MLTVKYIDPDGPERVFAVKEIEFTAERFQCQTHPPEVGRVKSSGRLRFVYPDGSDFYVCGGTVFAMNENGKTIAKYDLGGERLAGDLMGAAVTFTNGEMNATAVADKVYRGL